jgi:2,3-dihydroxybiphenyl 1,2-dioxygenase
MKRAHLDGTRHEIELGYLGLEVADGGAFRDFLAETIGIVPGDPTVDGLATWRNDQKAHRILVADGPANDAVCIGFEATDADTFESTLARLERAGHRTTAGTSDERGTRRVADLAHVEAPWGMRIEVVHGLADAPTPFASDLVAGGFLTNDVGFGHVVLATTAFDDSHQFVTEGLGMTQSDWVETEIAGGVELEVRFYHCNERHHSVALARAPFDLPQTLHHVMFEVDDRDDVGRAFDRAWNAGVGIANGLGRHDNDGMFSFYVVSPAGFQVEVGYGGRRITDDWDDNRRYDRISIWGHQPLQQGPAMTEIP